MTRLRYSDKPGDWRNLTWSSLGALALVAGLGAWRGRWPWMGAIAMAGAGMAVSAIAWAKPCWFRGWYRGVRWTGHQAGIVTGTVLLTVVFALVLWPLGWWLRLAGRRPFHERPEPRAGTYWRPARPPGSMERMY